MASSDGLPDAGASTETSAARYWFTLSAALLLADQVTKITAEQSLTLHQPQAVIPYLNWMLAYNPGAAFSFLSDAGGWQRWFFTAVAVAASGLSQKT